MTDEYEHEPIVGLPALLPPGETLLWQGAPDVRSAVLHIMHVHWIALYFGVLLAVLSVGGGENTASPAVLAIRLAVVGAAAISLLGFICWLIRRTTVYSITTRRVVMRFGIALPMTINLPYTCIGAADLKLYGDGTGDIALQLTGKTRIGYAPLWPHARRWHFSDPQPALRSVPEAQMVAQLLTEAMKSALADKPAPTPATHTGSASPRPSHGYHGVGAVAAA